MGSNQPGRRGHPRLGFPTPATTVIPNAEPPTDLSVVSAPRLWTTFADIEKYLVENYGSPTDKFCYQELYANGASLF